MKNKNHILYLLNSCVYNFLCILAIGSVFQTFMLNCGISESRVAVYVSVLQVSQTVVMLAISRSVERIKNVIKAVALSLCSFAVIFIAMIVICFCKQISVDGKYIILFGVGFFVNAVLGLYNILAYKLPHHIMSIKDYGWITGISGVVSCVIGAAFSALIGVAVKRFSYFMSMAVFSGIGIVLVISVIFIFSGFERREAQQNKKTDKSINLFKYKPFYQLLAPNFLRGFSFGIYNLVAVIGYNIGVIDGAGAALLVTLSQIASVISYQTYIPFAKHSKNGILCLVSCIAFCASLPFMTINSVMFYVFYFVSFVFINYINVTIPIIVAQHIEYECLGQYTAWRMALYTLGTAIGGAIVPALLGVGGTVTFAVCGVAMLPCGIGYYVFEKSKVDTK